MRRIPTTALAVLVSALTSAVAVAQARPATPPRPARAAAAAASRDSQPRAGRGGPARQPRGRQDDQPGGPRGRGPAAGMLRLRQQLELTDEQVKKLEAINEAPRPERHASDVLRARADLMDATRGDLNPENARAAFDRIAKMQVDQHMAQLKLRQDMRNVLTTAQRAKLDRFHGAMQRVAKMRGGKMRGGKMRAGKMRGGQMRGGQMRGGPDIGQGMRPGMMGQGMPGMQGMQGMQGRGLMRGRMMNPPDGPPQGPPPAPPAAPRPPDQR